MINIIEDSEIDIVELNRPERRNALNAQMLSELLAYFENKMHNTKTRVIILRGAGLGFCSGADLSESADSSVPAMLDIQQNFSNLIVKMRGCPQPIVALLHGACAGGGFAIALAADVRLAAPDTKFIPSFVHIGLSGGEMGASYFLPRLIGRSLATEILLTGRSLLAERALAVGLISDVVNYADLMPCGLAIAREMLRNSPLGLRMTKDLLNLNNDAPNLEAAIALETRTQVLCGQTEDLREGITAFLKKRPPQFTGR